MDENTRILEELFDTGYATREIPLIANKLTVKLRSLSASAQLEIEAEMGKDRTKNSPAAYIIHSYSLKLLSKTLVSYGNKIFKSSDEAYSFLENLTNSIIDKLVKAQNKLEKDVRKSLELESVEEAFSETGPLPEKPEQPVK